MSHNDSTPSYHRVSLDLMHFLFKHTNHYTIPTQENNLMKIGIGHIVDKFYNMKRVEIKDTIGLFYADRDECEDLINTWFEVLHAQQFDCLVSLVFDIGIDQFMETRIPKLLDMGLSKLIPCEIMKIDRINKIKQIRRKKEVNIYIGESYVRNVIGGITSKWAKYTSAAYNYDNIKK